MIATVFAAAAGALLAAGAVLAMPSSAELPVPIRDVVVRSRAELARCAATLRDLGSVTVPLTRARMRRVRLVAALGAGAFGGLLFGLRAGALCAAVAVWLAPRALEERRRRQGRRLDAGAAGAARAIADAVSAGASLRGSIAVAARRSQGPIAAELGRTAWELEIGAGTEAALARLRSRSASRAVALIVAAMQVQRRSGGDLASVLRDVAQALEQDQQVIEEADAATAQARFTAMVVVALPICGVALGALASPGLPGRMAGSPAGAALLTASLALQVSGVLLIRRIARSWS